MFKFVDRIWAVPALLLCLQLGSVELVDVQCTTTATEPNACYVLTPIFLTPTDTLNFVNATGLSNVTHFELKAFANFVKIPPVVWTVFPNLSELVLANYASINTIASTDFLYASKLKLVNLKGNKILQVPYSSFALAPQLESIDLSYNAINGIEDLAFNGLDKLEYLDLSYNRLPNLTRFTFSGAPNLKILDLSHNKIKLIEDGALSLPKLAHLNFNSNDVKLLPDNLFGVAPIQSSVLSYVDFGENKLSHAGLSIYNLNELTFLNLTANKKIDDLNLAAFAKLPKLETLLLSNTGIQFPLISPTDSSAPAPTSESPLKKLYLAKNKLANPDILKQLALFRELEVLSLEENRLTYLDNVESISEWFPELHTIYIGENKLDCAWLNVSIPVFQAADVHVFTIKKVKTWYGTTYETKLIDTEDCFDLEKIFDKILFFLNKFAKAV